ncbi:hypothetical protein [Ureaplasma ceti]|uniref:PTS EIIB type-1 domain-containing protein n=1 Tax=Ureaplasma ceti TaxID=3119530 RepID=A0ABP9UAB4_9BACT
MKKETKVKLFYIGTLGIGYFYAKRKAKKLAQTKNMEIKGTTSIDFKMEHLVHALGGKDNVVSVTSTISNVKVKLHDLQLVKIQELKGLGAKGTLKNCDSVTILFGDHSQTIAHELNRYLNLK